MTYILYTKKEGGQYFVLKGKDDVDTRERYDQAVKTRQLDILEGRAVIAQTIFFIALVEEIDNFDFQINRKRIEPHETV